MREGLADVISISELLTNLETVCSNTLASITGAVLRLQAVNCFLEGERWSGLIDKHLVCAHWMHVCVCVVRMFVCCNITCSTWLWEVGKWIDI